MNRVFSTTMQHVRVYKMCLHASRGMKSIQNDSAWNWRIAKLHGNNETTRNCQQLGEKGVT